MTHSLTTEIRACKACELYKLMPMGCKPVPGVGPLDAKIMIVGEALGADESILEEPFVGQCGQLLNKMLESAGLSRENCYITNVVKCRPVDGKKNRPPKKAEIDACKNWLYDEVMMIEPRVVFTLGRIPTAYFIPMKAKDKLGDLVGTEHQISKMKVVPLFHPSYLMQHSKKDIDSTIETLSKYNTFEKA